MGRPPPSKYDEEKELSPLPPSPSNLLFSFFADGSPFKDKMHPQNGLEDGELCSFPFFFFRPPQVRPLVKKNALARVWCPLLHQETGIKGSSPPFSLSPPAFLLLLNNIPPNSFVSSPGRARSVLLLSSCQNASPSARFHLHSPFLMSPPPVLACSTCCFTSDGENGRSFISSPRLSSLVLTPCRLR